MMLLHALVVEPRELGICLYPILTRGVVSEVSFALAFAVSALPTMGMPCIRQQA